MKHNEFFAALKAGQIPPLMLFEGTEEYVKQQALSRLGKALLPDGMEEMNRSELINPDADALIAAAETLPFLAEKRLVIVRECDLLTTSKKSDDDKLEALMDYLPKLSPMTCLVFVVKGKADGRKKLYLALKKRDAIVDFSPMSDMEAAGWAQKSMRALGKQIDATTAQKLVFTVGSDAALLKQEMDKLAHFVGEREAIAPEDIDEVCVKSLECTVFQMVDAQVAGRNAEAFRLLQSVLQNGQDRVGVLAMLLRQYRILYHARCLLEDRVPTGSQAALLGIPPFALTRTQAQAKRYAKERLKAAYDYLFDLEYRIKQGKASQEGCAEAAMLRLDAILTA